jgi:hypothetical protein
MTTERTPTGTKEVLARALREALSGAGPDGRIDTARARAVHLAIPDNRSECRNLFAEPETILGPFDSLPPTAQGALVSALDEDDRWRMAGFDLGRIHSSLARNLRRSGRRLRYGAAKSSLQFVAAVIQSAMYYGFHWAYRRFLSWRARIRRRPAISDILAEAGIDIRSLAVLYARGLGQLSGYRGFWHDPSRNTTVGLMVGLDFIANADGYWLIETNMDCGLLPGRTELYPEDPLVRALLDVAHSHGYRRLSFLAGSSSVPPEMTRQLRIGAAERGLALSISEDAFHWRFGHERTLGIPRIDGGDILLVRNRHYRTNVDYVIQHKRASSRVLRIYKQESGDTSFQLPSTSDEPVFAEIGVGDPYPNAVFKFPERDACEGVYFLKTESLDQARRLLTETMSRAPSKSALGRISSRLDDQEGIFQPYLKTPPLSDRRLYKTRAHVLITPTGVHFLSAHRMVCAIPLPETLPIGVVIDPSPYLVHWGPGSRYEVVPESEEPAVRMAALGVARGLAHALTWGFGDRASHPEPRKPFVEEGR